MAAGPTGVAGLPRGWVGAIVRRRRAGLVCVGGVAIVALAAAASPAGEGNLHDVPPDLVVPIAVEGEPQPGKRVFAVAPGWEGTAVRHTLALPRDWRPGVRLPVLVEYPGNGPYRNALGDVSEGTPEGCELGHGLSGGAGAIWLCLPCVAVAADGTRSVSRAWWGDVGQTLSYCRAAIDDVCARHGGDRERLVLCGFSRGAIACSYLGLHDDTVAPLWRGFFCHSHFDGVRLWPYAGSEGSVALGRLVRLAGRPVWISHELDVEATRRFLDAGRALDGAPAGAFTFVPIPYPNHSAAWVLRDLPERARARAWLREVLGDPGE